MTEQQESDPEYIITTAQLQAIKLVLGLSDNNRLLKEIRSRPVPAADENNVIKNLKAICEAQQEKIVALQEVRALYEQMEQMQPQHDAAIRNQTLDEIKQHMINTYNYPDIEDWLIEEIMSYLESLRSSSTTAKEDRR